MNRKKRDPLWVIGWREWVALPDLGVRGIKAKVDTGARSSVLHAHNLHRFRRGSKRMVRFEVHPYQRSDRGSIETEALVLEDRTVRSSSGETERRPVIRTTVQLLDRAWAIEFTLTNRDEMGFRMLLGRQAVRGLFLIDPQRSFLTGNALAKRP